MQALHATSSAPPIAHIQPASYLNRRVAHNLKGSTHRCKAAKDDTRSSSSSDPPLRPLGSPSTTVTSDQIKAARAGEDLLPSDAEVVPLTTPLALPSGDSRFQGLKVFVAGATGRTGRKVVERLVAEGVPVRALVRDAIKAVEVLPGLDKNVEIIEGDVSKFQTLLNAMQGCNTVVCATGATAIGNLFAPYLVDYEGTLNLIAVAQRLQVRHFVLVSSIGIDELLSPFNLFGGLAFFKKQAEQALQRSGLDFTIVRPGGLRDVTPQGQKTGGVVIGGQGEFGLLPGQRFPISAILRSQVADCCCEALVEDTAKNKLVEIVTEQNTPNRPWSELFSQVA